MEISFASRAVIAPDVLVREIDGESVLLNLQSQSYFFLDEVGTRMWAALASSDSISEACDDLLAEYDVEPKVLRQDLKDLIGKLVADGLLQLTGD